MIQTRTRAGRRPRRRAAGPPPAAGLVLITLAVVAVATVSRSSSPRTWVAVSVGLAACAALYTALRREGYRSIGGVTLFALAALFFGKWLAFGDAGAPLTTVGRGSAEGALPVVAAGAVGFAGGYLLILQVSKRRGTKGPVKREVALGAWLPIFAVSVMLILLRLVVGLIWGIGVPNRAPEPVPFVGELYYLTAIGPLVGVAAVRILARGRRSVSQAAALLASAYAGVGILLGWRGDIAKVALLWFAAGAVASRRSPGAKNLGRWMGTALAIMLGLLAMGLAISLRSGVGARPTGPGETASFFVQRVGGIDYLSPIVHYIDEQGTSRDFLKGPEWDRFLRVRLYGLPEQARTGFASTAFGWWYAIGGLGLTFMASVAAGALGALHDCFWPRWGGRVVGVLRTRVLSAVAILLWTNFFLEGTFLTSLSGLVVAVVLTFVFIPLATTAPMSAVRRSAARRRRRLVPVH